MTTIIRDDIGRLGPLTVAIGSGSESIGVVGGHAASVSLASTRVNDTNAYAPGDVWASATTNPATKILLSVARLIGGKGVITDLAIGCSANQATKPQLEIHFFRTEPTRVGDNTPVAMADADLESGKYVGFVAVGVADWVVLNAGAAAAGNCVAHIKNVNVAFQCDAASDDLSIEIVVRNAYTPVASERFDITVKVLQD